MLRSLLPNLPIGFDDGHHLWTSDIAEASSCQAKCCEATKKVPTEALTALIDSLILVICIVMDL